MLHLNIDLRKKTLWNAVKDFEYVQLCIRIYLVIPIDYVLSPLRSGWKLSSIMSHASDSVNISCRHLMTPHMPSLWLTVTVDERTHREMCIWKCPLRWNWYALVIVDRFSLDLWYKIHLNRSQLINISGKALFMSLSFYTWSTSGDCETWAVSPLPSGCGRDSVSQPWNELSIWI